MFVWESQTDHHLVMTPGLPSFSLFLLTFSSWFVLVSIVSQSGEESESGNISPGNTISRLTLLKSNFLHIRMDEGKSLIIDEALTWGPSRRSRWRRPPEGSPARPSAAAASSCPSGPGWCSASSSSAWAASPSSSRITQTWSPVIGQGWEWRLLIGQKYLPVVWKQQPGRSRVGDTFWSLMENRNDEWKMLMILAFDWFSSVPVQNSFEAILFWHPVRLTMIISSANIVSMRLSRVEITFLIQRTTWQTQLWNVDKEFLLGLKRTQSYSLADKSYFSWHFSPFSFPRWRSAGARGEAGEWAGSRSRRRRTSARRGRTRTPGAPETLGGWVVLALKHPGCW